MQSSIPRCFGRTRRTAQTTSADAPAPREIIEEWSVTDDPTTSPLRQWSQPMQRRIRSMTDDARVPAHIVYTEDGETFHTYEIDGIPDPSAKAVKAEFETRHPF